jgi:hypothetical protein
VSTMTITVTREALHARRAEILEYLGLPLPQYRRLIAEGRLGSREWEVRDEMAEIGFLLGEDQ